MNLSNSDPASPARSRSRTWTLRSLAIVASVLVSLTIVEVTTRILYEAPWHERLETEQRQSQQHAYRKNALGLRDLDYESPKPPDHQRVLLLGDSFTFGSGVFDDERVFPEIVERMLNEREHPPGVRRIDVLNGGIHGSLTKDWLILYRRIEKPYEPDVVVSVFFLRDGTMTGSVPAFFDPIRKTIVARNRASWPYRISYAFRMIRDHFDRRQISEAYTQEFQKAYFGEKSETAEWQRAQRHLLRLRDLASERGAVFGLVVFPVLVDLRADDYPFQRICDEVTRFAIEHDIPVLDLLPAFRGQVSPDLWVSPVDQHPNSEGHRIAAEALLPFVSRLLDELEKRR